MSDEYVVVETDIPFGSAYAYRKGDKIKKEAVEANGWQDYVKSTKETTTAAGGKDK